MIWLKRTGKWMVFALLFVIGLITFLLTPWGTSTIISIANNSVDGLDIKHKSGGLFGTIELQSIGFNSPAIKLDASDIKAEIDWSCSLLMQVCVNQLYLGQAEIVVAESQEPESKEALEKITLPVTIVAPNIQINDFSVDLQNVAKISWQSLFANMNMRNTLNIETLELDQPKIVLVEPLEPAQSATHQQEGLDIAQISNWQFEPIKLPPLVIPIDIDANSISITNARVVQSQEPIFAFNRLSTQIKIQNSNVTLNTFNFEHEMVNVNAELALTNKYEITLSTNAQTTASNQSSFSFQATASGDLQALEFDTQLSGDINASAQGSANLDSEKLPIDVRVQWQPITLPSEQPIQLSSGNLIVKGDLDNYQLDLQTSLSAENIPQSQIVVSGNGNNQKFQLAQAKVTTLGGTVQTSGTVTLTDVATWQGTANIEQIQPGLFWSELEGNINANVKHKGVYGPNTLQAQIEQINANGNWLGYPLKVNGSANYDKNLGLNVPSFNLSNGDNKLTFSGQVDNQNALNGIIEFQGNVLAQLYPDLEGKTALNARISGTVNEPEVAYELSASELKFENISLQNLTSNGQVKWDQEKQFSLVTDLEQLIINRQPIDKIQFELIGNAYKHQLTTTVASEVIQLESTIDGQLGESKWNGTWKSGRFKSQWGTYRLNQDNTQILADWQNQHYQLDAHCWIDQQAKLCIEKANFADKNAEFDINGSDLELLQIVSQFVPQLQDITTDTQFYFTAKGKWQADSLPVAKVEGHFSPSAVKIKGLKKPLEVEKLAFDMSIDGKQLITKFDFLTKNSGAIDVDLTISDLDEQRTLLGEVRLKEVLAKPYQELIPQLTELSGSINGNLALTGDLKTPLLDGKLQLKSFNFTGEDIPGRVSEWNQEMEFAGQTAKLKGDFMFGDGKGSSSGTLDWSEELIGDFNLTGDTFELEYRDMVRTRFSPNLKVEMTKTDINVTGSTDVLYARIKVKDLPESAQSPSEDTVIINQPAEEKTAGRNINLAFNVNIDPKKSNDVKLEALGLKTDLQGSLELKQKNQKLTGVGSLSLRNGTYKSFGQDLIIQKGNILFSGPLDNPRLDIEAIRDESKTEDDVIAGVRVSGPAEEPSVVIFSEPTMVQSEALSYLLQGKSLSSESETSNDQILASALLSQGLAGSEKQVNQLGRKLGIEDLALGASSDDDGTQISLSGNIAPGVQLRYGVNVFDSSAEVALRYQILPKLYLEATSGVEIALDIYYQFSLGGRSGEEKN